MLFLKVAAFFAICSLAIAHEHHDHHDHHAHPKYEFKYGVKDLKTGDIKDQWEHRDGDNVKGSYSLKEADGTTRVVEYHADAKTGFHAEVKKIGHAHHPDTHNHHEHHAAHYDHHAAQHAAHYEHHAVHHDAHHAPHHGGHHSHHNSHDHGHATSYIDVHHY